MNPLTKPDLSAKGPLGGSGTRRAHALEAWGDALAARVAELEGSLDRTLHNFRLLLAGKPVVEAEETIAEAMRLLGLK